MRQYEENGYRITEYNNGAVVRELIGEPIPEPTPMPVTLSEQEQLTLETAVNVEYLVSLKEMEM